MSYDICLFDLDGTLLDPKEGITNSFQYALRSFGIHEETDNLTPFIGPPLRESFRDSYGFSKEEQEKAVESYREYFIEYGLYQNIVYEGIPELLAKLKDKKKILAVATSKLEVYAQRILKHFGIDDYFSFVAGDTMDGSRTAYGKRDVILRALMNIDPKRENSIVMIGDRKHDIAGAKETEIDSIGILWGYGSKQELTTAGADRLADSCETLYKLIIS